MKKYKYNFLTVVYTMAYYRTGFRSSDSILQEEIERLDKTKLNKSEVQFNALSSNIVPSQDSLYDLGNVTHKYDNIYVNTLRYSSLDPPISGGGGGSSQWITSGSNIYYNLGSVGIGTNIPSSKLHVNGTASINGTLTMNNNNINNVNDINAVNLKGTVCYCDTLNEKSTTGNILVLENLDFATIKSLNRVKDITASQINSTEIKCNSFRATSLLEQIQFHNSVSFNGVTLTDVSGLFGFEGSININSNLDMNNSNISGVKSLTVDTLFYNNLSPPIISGGTSTKLFLNRTSAIPLNIANTATLLSILGTSADYVAHINSGFTLDETNHRIYYSNQGTKNFYVQTSFSFLGPASVSNVAFEIRKNNVGVSHARFTVAASGGNDLQDYNIISLTNGDYISFFYSCSNSTSTLTATPYGGFGGATPSSTPKPVQIFITEI